MISLAKSDEIKYFKILWSILSESFNVLIDSEKNDVWQNPLLHIIMKNGEINNYIKKKYRVEYEQVMMKWIKEYANEENRRYGFKQLFKSISSAQTHEKNGDEVLQVILKQLFEFIGDSKKKLKHLILMKERKKKTGSGLMRVTTNIFIRSIINYVRSFSMILHQSILTQKELYQILITSTDSQSNEPLRLASDETKLLIYQHYCNDKKMFYRLITEMSDEQYVYSRYGRLTCKRLQMVLDSPFFTHQVCDHRNLLLYVRIIYKFNYFSFLKNITAYI